MTSATKSQMVDIGDTRLHVVERGGGSPVIILHGGPGLDHHSFGDYLDPLADQFRLIFVDQRAQGLSEMCAEETWTLQKMAADVVALAKAMSLEDYAVLGHSYGAFVALQNAVDFPGSAARTIVSSGLPSARFLKAVDANLAKFEPVGLREQVTSSWARERDVKTHEDVALLLHDQLPFQFADPLDPRIPEYERRCNGSKYSPHVLRKFARADYGGIEVEDRLDRVAQPVLVLAGQRDRTCTQEGAEQMVRLLPNALLMLLRHSGHMTFVEQNEEYLRLVREFLSGRLERVRTP
jgi:proline iminopeptidase